MGLRILVPRPRLRPSLVRANKFVWAALAVAVWGIAYTFLGAGGLAGVLRAEAEIDVLEQRVEEAAAANARLEETIRQAKSDPETIERLAREEFYLAKPGEKVYLLPESPEPEPESNEAPPSDPEPLPEDPGLS